MDYNNLPMILTPKDVQAVLGLPINQVYRLFKSKRFPSERVNGKHIIPKPRFLNWLGEDNRTAV
jgi:predicted DNA-binding transcriptional regulator AlpA